VDCGKFISLEAVIMDRRGTPAELMASFERVRNLALSCGEYTGAYFGAD